MFFYEECLKKYSTNSGRNERKASKFFFNSNWLPDKDDSLREFHYATVKTIHAKAQDRRVAPSPELHIQWTSLPWSFAVCTPYWVKHLVHNCSLCPDLRAPCFPWAWDVKVLHSPLHGVAHLGKFGFLVFASFPLAQFVLKVAWLFDI